MSLPKLLEHPPNYPDFVEGYISQLMAICGYTREEILTEYKKAFEASGVGLAQQFASSTPEKILEIRQMAAISKVYREMKDLAPVKDYTIVYIGHQGLRVSASKKPYCNVYVASESGIARIACNGKHAEIYKSLIPMTKYTATLSRFGNSGDFSFDQRCKFINPTPLGLDIYGFLTALGIPILTIEQLPLNPSKTTSDGYAIPSELRCVFGNFSGEPRVITSKTEKLADGSAVQLGVCNITDLTVKQKPYTDAKGTRITPGITCWAAPEFLMYDTDGYFAFIGTVSLKKDEASGLNNPVMNAVYIYPLISAPQSAVRDE